MLLSSARDFVVTDLGYGDAGKGSIVDYLAREAATRAEHDGFSTVVRFNGGPQAAHNVVQKGKSKRVRSTGKWSHSPLTNGRAHTFSQFGSGTFVPNTRTLLARDCLVNPLNMMTEAKHLSEVGVRDPFTRLLVAEGTLVITDVHKYQNRTSVDNVMHGTCGEGVGVTMQDALENPDGAIRWRDLLDKRLLCRKLAALCERFPDFPGKREWVRVATTTLHFAAKLPHTVSDDWHPTKGRMIFEGAQGVLLDEWHGFHPYTTWSTTTPLNARALLSEWGRTDSHVLGLTRSYMVRHGNGPLVTESDDVNHPELHNEDDGWQGKFRRGHLDLPALRYAQAVSNVDSMVLTHCDRLRSNWNQVCVAYDEGELVPSFRQDLAHQAGLTAICERATPVYANMTEIEVKEAIEEIAPISIYSWGATAEDKTERG